MAHCYIQQNISYYTLSFNSLYNNSNGTINYTCVASLELDKKLSLISTLGLVIDTFKMCMDMILTALYVSGLVFQIRLKNIYNCLEWASSDVIMDRLMDVMNAIANTLEERCQCGFIPSDITDGGFRCFR